LKWAEQESRNPDNLDFTIKACAVSKEKKVKEKKKKSFALLYMPPFYIGVREGTFV
jgi:hypothetical protein